MMRDKNTDVNHLRQLLCLPDTPANRSAICAACLSDMMWDMAEAHIKGLKAWADRQNEIAIALERHGRRHGGWGIYEECGFSLKDLSGADLRNADLSGANLEAADLSGADLQKACLYDARLREAVLSNSNLKGASLRYANLRSANLEGADISGADIRDAYLLGIFLMGSKYSKRTRFPAGFIVDGFGMVEADE